MFLSEFERAFFAAVLRAKAERVITDSEALTCLAFAAYADHGTGKNVKVDTNHIARDRGLTPSHMREQAARLTRLKFLETVRKGGGRYYASPSERRLGIPEWYLNVPPESGHVESNVYVNVSSNVYANVPQNQGRNLEDLKYLEDLETPSELGPLAEQRLAYESWTCIEEHLNELLPNWWSQKLVEVVDSLLRAARVTNPVGLVLGKLPPPPAVAALGREAVLERLVETLRKTAEGYGAPQGEACWWQHPAAVGCRDCPAVSDQSDERSSWEASEEGQVAAR